MYQDLLEMERKLDWMMMRKKVEIEDALARVQPVRQLDSIRKNPITYLMYTKVHCWLMTQNDALDHKIVKNYNNVCTPWG